MIVPLKEWECLRKDLATLTLVEVAEKMSLSI